MKTVSKFFQLTTLFVLSISITSCEDKVQIDIESKGKVLCVDGFINDLRQNQKIRLTYTDSYFSGQKPPALVGATFVLKDVTLNKTINFTDKNNGDYVYTLNANDTIIYTNHKYDLFIKYNNYEYKSSSICKRTVSIDSLWFEYKEASNASGNTVTKAGNRLRLLAADATGPIPDYYWIKIYKNGKFYDRTENIQLEWFGNDNEYDGQLFFEEKWNTSGPDGPVDPCVAGDIARLEIHGISREAYDFFQLGIQMSNNGGLFAGTPVNLPTNIFPSDKNYPKSVGIFCVSAVSFKEKVSP
jgi:hypothetical protein